MAAATPGQRLVLASREGSIEQALPLLDEGVDVDSMDVNGWTGLMWASYRGSRAIVLLLLERGATVDTSDADGRTALAWASRCGHLPVVELLQDRGADIHLSIESQRCALSMAASYDHLTVCEFLLSKGADLMAADAEGRTALSHYGHLTRPRLSPETKALRCTALEAAWAAGPHPSQVQRRRDERWFRRGPILWVLAEHGFRPLQLRALAIALAAASLDPFEPVMIQTSRMRDVFSDEGLSRYIILFL